MIAASGLLVVVVLSGCTPADPNTDAKESSSAPSVAPSGDCFGEIEYPDLPVWDLNQSLPFTEVQTDYVRTEILIHRGTGACAGGMDESVSGASACNVLSGPSESNVDVQLGRTADGITTAQFDAGASAVVSETVSGYAAEGTFTYRMTAWKFSDAKAAAKTPVHSLLSACEDPVEQSIDGHPALTLRMGDEPFLSLLVVDDIVFLVESIERIGADGSPLVLTSTRSGLMPEAAFDEVVTWWLNTAPETVGRQATAA